MKRVFIISLILCFVHTAWAQSPGTVTLTLDQAIRIALDENPTIEIANLEIERYDYVRKETLGNLYPNASATASYSRTLVEQKLGGSISFGGKNTFAGTGSVTLPLFAPGIYSALKLNREQMAGAVESARSSRITLVNEVKKAYYNILLLEQSLGVLDESHRTISETVDNTRTMFDNGLASEYDLLTAEVQLSNLQPTVIQTRNGLATAKLLLKMYLSLPPEVDVAVEGRLDDSRDTVLATGAIPTGDLSENSDLRAIDIQERMLAQSLKVQRTQRYPTLGAFFNYQFVGQDLDLGALAGMMGGGAAPPSKYRYNWQHPTSVGVQLSIPIFAGFSRTNKERQIKNTISQLQLQREYVEDGLNVQIRSAINDLLTAYEKMSANERTVTQAGKAYEISEVRFRSGAGTILELNSAELNLTQAKLNYSQAIYDYLSAQADYDKLVGREN